uniref:Retrotransposon gag domain-containing protein n=1 Tax=Sinocyclocheilus rhinocerous TaxID=307959 RepID=A0A673G1B2_9TELE
MIAVTRIKSPLCRVSPGLGAFHLEHHKLATRITRLQTPTKRATLLHCLGTEGQRIFYALPETGDTYASAISALQKHFTPKVNVVVERYAFRKHAQFPHETIAQYVAALRAHAATCGFEDKADDMIRDQLLEHLCSDSIRERLLLESDLTLDTAVTLATQMEAAADQAKKNGLRQRSLRKGNPSAGCAFQIAQKYEQAAPSPS